MLASDLFLFCLRKDGEVQGVLPGAEIFLKLFFGPKKEPDSRCHPVRRVKQAEDDFPQHWEKTVKRGAYYQCPEKYGVSRYLVMRARRRLTLSYMLARASDAF